MMFLTITAAIIIIVLSSYALILFRKVKQMEAERSETERRILAKQTEQRATIQQSIQVIAANVINEDLNLSEATIRCKMLLDALLLNEEQRKPFQILEQVFNQVKDFDTHQARRTLSQEERHQQDEQRDRIEKENQAELMDCFRLLCQFTVD